MSTIAGKGQHNSGAQNLFSGFFSDIDRMYGSDMFMTPRRYARSNMPAANLRETEKAYVLELAVPGMDRHDFIIEADRDVLSVSCHKEEHKTGGDTNYSLREYNYSSFSRTFRLPHAIVADKIEAQYNKGVLHITVPKAEQKQQHSKRINVA